MYKFLILFLILIISNISLQGQNSEIIQIKGIVINEKHEPLSFVHILNLSRRKGATSNSNGEFDFFSNKGDTLRFTCIGHKSTKKIIPLIISEKIYHIIVVLKSDTLMLPETIVLPWQTYQEFKEAVLAVKIPDDDKDRATKNLALMELQQILYPDEMPIASGAARRIFLYEHYDKLYYKGQNQPMQIYNVIAWQEFFKYLQEGKFKYKKKKKK